MNTVDQNNPAPVRDDSAMVSVLEIVDIETKERKVVKEFPGVIIEAPSWLKTRNVLVYNSQGKIYEISLENGAISQVDTIFIQFR